MKFNQFEMMTPAEHHALRVIKKQVDRTPADIREMNSANRWYDYPAKPMDNPFGIAELLALHEKGKRPFYKMWPGFLENIEHMKLPETMPPLNIGVESLELDFPTTYTGIQALTLFPFWEHDETKSGKMAWIICAQGDTRDDTFSTPPEPSDFGHIVVCSQHTVTGLTPYMCRIIYALYLIHDNPEIIRPIVLNKDKEKFESTGDKKYIEKAIKYGIVGHDVGRDIPTRAEIARMREENQTALLHGKVCPHIRCSHLQLYWTGKGRTEPKIKLVKEAFVNWENFKDIPQGYHDK
mgnify:CR=1 FL=1